MNFLKLNNKIFLIFLLFAFFIGLIFYRNAQDTKPKSFTPKHIVLINIDSLRADHMGTYGYNKNTTPFLDTLFKKGIVFENAITPSFLTFQTDAAIFSSLYPSQNGVMTFLTPINKNLPILPSILKSYGYNTAAFVSPSAGPQFGWSDSFQTYKWNKDLKNIASTKKEVASWLITHNEPFFLFWHIYDVHIPYVKPDSKFYKEQYNGAFTNQKMWTQSFQSKDALFILKDPKKPDNFTQIPITPTDIDYIKASYDSGISYVDNELKLFFESIKDKPFFKDTLFIISSEHGEDLKEHGYIFHGDIYDVNTHVPLAFIYPSLKPQRIKENVTSLDILPTILELLHIPSLQRAEGKSLVPAIGGKTIDSQRNIFTERPPFDEYSLRRGSWKYILRNPDKKRIMTPTKTANTLFINILKSDDTFTDELYNLSEDHTEQHNLIGKGLIEEKELKDEIITFREKMRGERKSIDSSPLVDPNKLIPYP